MDMITETRSRSKPPGQSLGPRVRFPGAYRASRDLGVTYNHLWQVLSGHRESLPLLARWRAWLAAHPEFAALQRGEGGR